jgi:hypothetical protein
VIKAQRLNSIGATDIRRQRGEVVTEEVQYERDDGTKVAIRNVDRVQDFFSRYEARGELNSRQAKAGKRFMRDAEGSGIWPKSSMSGSGGGDLDVAIWKIGDGSRQPSIRLKQALVALGPCAAVVWAVAVQGRSAHEWATVNHKVPRDGMALLRAGLDALVDHYMLDS